MTGDRSTTLLAHGLGGSTDLPIPFTYAVVGAAWALTFTFAVVPVHAGTLTVLAVLLGSTAFGSFSAMPEWRNLVDENTSTAFAATVRTTTWSRRGSRPSSSCSASTRR